MDLVSLKGAKSEGLLEELHESGSICGGKQNIAFNGRVTSSRLKKVVSIKRGGEKDGVGACKR